MDAQCSVFINMGKVLLRIKEQNDLNNSVRVSLIFIHLTQREAESSVYTSGSGLKVSS